MKKYLTTMALLGASYLTFAQAQVSTVSEEKKERTLKLPYDDVATEEDQTVEAQVTPTDSSDYAPKSKKEMRKKGLLVQRTGSSSRYKASTKKEE